SANSERMMYDLDAIFPPDIVSEVDPGTNLLLSGPSLSGKRDLMLEVLTHGVSLGEGGVVVTTNDPATDIYQDFRSVREVDGDYLRFIDCVSSQSGGSREVEGVKSVSSPGDLTGIGIEFSEIAREASTAGVDQLRIGFDSITPLLMYVDLQRLFRFLHVFTRQIQSNDWLGLFTIDPSSHETQTVNTINQLFDGIVDVRLPEDGGREARVRGITSSPTDWVELE
ncbi:MAG: RAD55 family ATPase, partial [Halanaeroarchaeum sp.]